MSEVKDPAIKLFGKTIQLPCSDDGNGADLDCEQSSHDQNICSSNEKNDAASDSKQEDGSSSTVFVEPNNTTPTKSSTSQKEEQSETESSSQDNNNNNNKLLKKPDKIIPCPRCNSMDTKFCYFNNYNVNQPRHFCKNCQRYWTAGGTMRNVPVGAGRRKSKNTTPNNVPRHIIIPDPIQTRPNAIIYPASPLCESMASALNIVDSKSHLDNTTKPADQESMSNNVHGGFVHQVPCFPGQPWAQQWNPAQWNGPMPGPPILPPGFPVSVYPTPPYWGPWGMPLMIQRPPTSSVDHSLTNSSPNSPLGKHSREGKVLTPKTLRIDDPNEAAKSSIWATLGIKNEKKGDSINSGGLFRGFKSKGDDISSASNDTPLVLQANPAAMSRSITFQESAQ